MAKILVTGAKGQLGHKISQLLTANYELILTDSEEMDITNKEKVSDVLRAENPDYIIHGAAYTKVDAAEENEGLCRKINTEGTNNIAETAKELGIVVIYISTDYVFDGKKNSPYSELDTPYPLSVYGQTKLEGENIIKEICDKYYILRVAWLFGELPENHPGTNFIETILRLGEERDSLTVVNDQIGSPTYTKDLVETFSNIIEKSPEFGLYHFSGEDACSWYDFAKEIFRISEVKIDLKPITSDQYPQKAKRPDYSYMSKDKIKKEFGINVRSWQEMVREYLEKRK